MPIGSSMTARVRELFANAERRKARSKSAVTHDKLDDTYLEDFRAKASKFDSIFENSPDIPIGDAPDKCPTCASEEPNWTVQSGKMVCSACSTPVAMPEGPYSPWQDLVSDVWRSFFTYDEPTVKRQDDVDESRELNRRVISRLINSDEFLDTRPLTRLKDFESAATAMTLVSELKDSLRDGALAEHARRAEKMQQYERDMDQIEHELEALRDKFEQGTLSDAEKQRLRELAEAHSQANASLDQLAQDQATQPIGIDVAEAIDEAIDAAHEDAEMLSGMPGIGAGAGTRVTPDVMFALADKFRKSEVLQRVAEILGRLERDMRYKRANRVKGGFEEVVDIEQGDDLSRVLASELMRLRHPLMKLDFYRRFHEEALTQFEFEGSEPEGRGPIGGLVDGSGSMDGDRNAWARAVAIATIILAHKEKRDAFFIEFGSASEQKAWFFGAREPLNPEDILDFASHYFGGGTDIAPAVAHANKIMEQVPEFKKADLVIITDGEDYFGADDAELKHKLHSRGVRIHGIAISEGLGYLGQMCDNVTHVTDLALGGTNQATDALATQLT